MKRPVIAIGLDAAEPPVIERWLAEGHLPTLRRLREQGAYGRIQNFDYYRAETPWTTFLTGCSPHKTGYWSPIKFQPDKYEADLVEAYEFDEFKPFYALGQDYRVAVFDMPQTTLSEDVNGVQVLAWGAHSPQTPSHSQPESLFQEIVDQYGPHPGLHEDHADCYDLKGLEKLRQVLETGIERRGKICRDLLKRDRWDLLLTMFGEAHAAGHFMWHLSQPDHPLYEVFKPLASGDMMLSVFQAIDRAIAEIISAAPEDAYIVVFSAHGMASNIMDLPSGTFLPEFLYRWSFPGQYGLAKGDPNTPPGAPIARCQKDSWLWDVWSRKHDTNPLRSFLRSKAPYKVFKKLEPLFGRSQGPDLVSPHLLNEQSDPLCFQPTEWYKPCWPQMKAFALPSFSEGYIRINLKGREAQGIVAPEEYDAVCEEITRELRQMKDARTGTPMVTEVMRTRKSPLDNDPKLPDADLVVLWQEQYATDIVDSPTVGRIGPVPHFRTGSHRSQGFLFVQGPEVEAHSEVTGHALDLAPTILSLMDAPIPEQCEGKALLKTKVLAS